jgi:hypothetical protein
MDKPIGAFLQAGAAFMFYAAGAFGGDAMLLLVPAAASGVAGLLLWARGSKTALPPGEQSVLLERQMGQVQESLESLHKDVQHLREDRDFFEKLYPGAPAEREGSRTE